MELVQNLGFVKPEKNGEPNKEKILAELKTTLPNLKMVNLKLYQPKII